LVIYSTARTWPALIDSCSFSVYNIDYTCATRPQTSPFTQYLNLQSVKYALHAPNKTYSDCNSTILKTLSQELVEPPAYSVIPALLDAGIKVHIYSGDNDLLLNHIGTELVLQNMTWGGLQGLQEKPDKAFEVDGVVMGNWGSEVCAASSLLPRRWLW